MSKDMIVGDTMLAGLEEYDKSERWTPNSTRTDRKRKKLQRQNHKKGRRNDRHR